MKYTVDSIYIGLMTGTSADSLDCAAVNFSKKEMKNKFIKAGFQNVKTFVVYNPIEFESFPTKSFSFGQFFPNFIKSFLGKIFGLGLVIIASK